ncbi:DUF3224 domain-containing protein [Streptomyces sp. RGM 3693]|uniref:DUF3224 domain-containing protein n=1 Tax=Streptomyces sp. RGM 3693 TaxID=3413284 RepID=UPI003D2C7C25
MSAKRSVVAGRVAQLPQARCRRPGEGVPAKHEVAELARNQAGEQLVGDGEASAASCLTAWVTTTGDPRTDMTVSGAKCDPGMRASGTFKVTDFTPTPVPSPAIETAVPVGVPGSGTGELVGITGVGGIAVDPDGTHRIWFDYDLGQ